ncbi:MAG: hypothetical protein WCK05_02660, partial [Planctomycetota bacterium]
PGPTALDQKWGDGGSSLLTLNMQDCPPAIAPPYKKVLLGDRNPRMDVTAPSPNPLLNAASSGGTNSKNHSGDGQNFFLLNQQTLWTEYVKPNALFDTRLDEDPYSPLTDNAANFSAGKSTHYNDSFLLQ